MEGMVGTDVEAGHGDLGGALGQDDRSNYAVVSDGFGSVLQDGDLSNKIVILMQYLQMTAIFLTPSFFIELPTEWLK